MSLSRLKVLTVSMKGTTCNLAVNYCSSVSEVCWSVCASFKHALQEMGITTASEKLADSSGFPDKFKLKVSKLSKHFFFFFLGTKPKQAYFII